MIEMRLKTVSFTFIFLFLFSCSNEPDTPITNKLERLSSDEGESLLLAEVSKLNEWILDQQQIHDSTHGYIYDNILFKDLYQNSYKHKRYTRNILVDDSVSLGVKKLLIRCLQCLRLEDYLSIGLSIMDVGNIELMQVFISPGPAYGTILDDNFQNPLVNDFSEKLVNYYPLLKEDIYLTLSGSNFRKNDAYRDAGEKRPIMICSPPNK